MIGDPVKTWHVRPPYHGEDPRTPQQKAEDLLHKQVAILDVMARDEHNDHPNAIAHAAGVRHGYPLRASLGRGGFRPGAGTIVSSMIRSLHRAGLIGFSSRRDGLTGSAYVITKAGRDFLAVHREVLDRPWHDPACYEQKWDRL